MDSLRRLRGKRRLAILVVGLAVFGMLALAYYDSEGRKGDAANAVAVAVSAPLTGEQEQALRQQFERYAPEDNRAPVALSVHVLDGGDAAEKLEKAAAAMNAGFPNLYLIEDSLREELGRLVPLELLIERYPDDNAVEDSVYYALDGKAFLNVPELVGLPECSLALQKSDTYAVTKDAQTQSYYAYQSELLDNIAADTPVQP